MKLHRLELEGFGPFRTRQTVDFDAFDDDGIFLITGRTGAGKSSILDGVCFALFGSAPRYDGGEKRLRSDHSSPDDRTEVRLEFSAADSRWRVTRAPEYERPKARGEGLTPVAHSALLEEWFDGAWIGRAARPRDVAHRLDEIVGLNQQQFLQVILLAQNRFAQFLLAKNDDRQALLRTLFGSRTYEDYQRALDQRRKDAEQSLARTTEGVAMLLSEAELLALENDFAGEAAPISAADIGARLDAGVLMVQRASYRADTLDRERHAAAAALTEASAALVHLSAVHEKQGALGRSRTALAGLEQRLPDIAHERSRLDRANAAEVLRATIESTRRAAAAVSEAATSHADAAASWAALGETAVDASAVRARVDAITGQLTLAEAALAAEQRLTALTAQLQTEQRGVARLAALADEIEQRRREVPGRLAELDAQLAASEGAALACDVAAGALAASNERLGAARESERRAATMRAAEADHAARLTASRTATADVAALLQRRLAGHAGELAAALVDGVSCAVCGSTVHPLPAEIADEPVTEAMIAHAEQAKDAAAAAERMASVTAREARAAHADAAAQASGVTVETALEAVAAAQNEHDRATTAATLRENLVGQRTALLAAESAIAFEWETLMGKSAEAREAVALTTQAASAADEVVDAARGEFASVAARVSDAIGRRDIGQRLCDAIALHERRRSAADEAAADLEARIAESEFADTEATVAALVDASGREALEARLREFDHALHAERERMLALTLELAGRADEPVDLAAAKDVVARAETTSAETTTAAVGAAHVAERLRSLVSRADAAQSDAAVLVAEHALVAGLANAVAGRNASRMDLETFVLAAELEEIVAAANIRLDDMSSGRYQLRHTDALAARNAASGLGLAVLDSYTGQARPPQSLSGGETFVASLALALGLAEVVTARAGGIRLDTLFIDEGFGSLDAETLDVAMRTLDELRQGGRTVGVISHVEAMKDALPAQLTVRVTHHGWSVVQQSALSAASAQAAPPALSAHSALIG